MRDGSLNYRLGIPLCASTIRESVWNNDCHEGAEHYILTNAITPVDLIGRYGYTLWEEIVYSGCPLYAIHNLLAPHKPYRNHTHPA